MVTFALPGDYDAASETSGTPKARPPLPFAKRGYVPTPYATKRFGTPQSSARKAFTTRDEIPASSLNYDSMSSSRNIFRASTVNDSPSVTPFTPSLPQGTMKKVFAPGVTPEPSRVYREATAKATPRGVAVHAPEKELFSLRIASPPPELTGEVLADKVPKDWNSNGSIYADQFLSHLCPPDLDEEQRRQFFCILDLRRLKYAANEIFAKKSWKLNIINFAKEFEKSRSIILLRYGLYEFQNVKPSKEVLKRWRREHGLPEPLEDEADDADADADADPTPTKPATLKKRKADDNMGKNALEESFPGLSAKRRAMVREEADEPTAATPAPIKNKRKASMTEDSPSKLQKATPSSAKSLFEKIANKPSPAPSSTPASKPPSKLFEGAAAAKSSLFGTEPAKTPLASSVFSSVSKASPSPAPATPSPNIFGYLSDGGSAKNGSVEVDADADAESETDYEPEPGESQETAISVEQSGATNGAGESDSQSSLFNIQSTAPGLETGTSSGTGTRESTPGRSLFDRVTKDKDGQPVRASVPASADHSAEAPTPLNQTWNPSTSPIKFAPTASASTNSLFGLGGSTSSSLFPSKSSINANLFGAPKSATKDAPKALDAEKDKASGESDKENDARPSKRPAAEARPALQPNGSSSLFSTKPAPTEAAKEAEPSPAKPASNLFGSAFKPDASVTTSLFGSAPKVDTSATTSLFGSAPKDAPTSSSLFGSAPKDTPATSSLFGSAAKETPSTSSLFGSAPKDTAPAAQSTLFGATPAGAEKKEEERKSGFELPKTNSLFGASAAIGTPSNLFAPPKPATNGTNLFGGASSTPSPTLFGTAPAAASPAKADPTSAPQPAAAPVFSFGASTTNPTLTSQAAANSLFGMPKSPQESAEGNIMGSPMKQDTISPAKKPFAGIGTNTAQPPPVFSFGSSAPAPAPAPAVAPSLFGSNATPATSSSSTSNLFGGNAGATAPAASSSFNFSFGASSTPSGGSAVNNPFASGNAGTAATPAAAPTGNIFSFGGSSAPSGGSGGSGSMFQFGASNGTPAAPSSAPLFGAAPSSGNTPAAAPPTSSGMFTFGATQPTPSFGATQPTPSFGSNLQPPAGGSSTTGTNSPFNLGGGSSLATTPAGGTPEPSNQAAAPTSNPDNNDEDGEKHEQVCLTGGGETDEEVLHDVRAKVLKFVCATAEGEEKAKSKSPWVTQGLGPLRLLKHKETNVVRLVLRAEPRGNVALNKLVLPGITYKADEKYVKLTTSNAAGDGLETWMIQVKTKDMAKALAEALETNKEFNKKAS